MQNEITQNDDKTYASDTKLRALLSEELLRLQTKNPSYSLRRFARRLGIIPSALSGILNGRRTITSKMAQKIIVGLGLPSEDFHGLVKVSDTRKKRAGKSVTHYSTLDMDQFHLMSDWYYFAIYSLIEIERFEENAEWIGKELGISPQKAQLALKRLEKLGVIGRDENDRLIPKQINVKTTTDISNLAIRRGHYQNLDRARESLDHDPVELRDFSDITMTADPALLGEAKTLIRNFRRDLAALLEAGSKKEVYRMCIQLFPLTQGEPK